MRIDGYDFEVTPFDTEGEADEAYRVARAADKPIMGGKVICHAIGGPYIVKLYNQEETWYL